MIVAGFGFRVAAGTESLRSALDATRAAPQALAAPQDKCDAPVFRAFADALGLPVIPVTPDALRAAETLTRAPRVIAERGTGSVAEAAALSAAGQNGRLLGPRVVSADRLATCAIAEGHDP